MSQETEAGSQPKRSGLLSRLNPLERNGKPPIPEERDVSPEYKAGFFSIITFSWMSSIMAVGYRRPLELNDIWLINPNRSAHLLAKNLRTAFEGNNKSNVPRPLLRAIWQVFKKDIILGGICAFLFSSAQVTMPLVVKYIISFASRAYYSKALGLPSPSSGEGVGLVVCLTVLQVIASLANNQFFYRGMIVGGQTRAALISIIFDKAMTISGRAKAGGRSIEDLSPGARPTSDEEKKHFGAQLQTGQNKERTKKNKKKDKENEQEDESGWGNGRIVNLMSVDTYRIDQACGWVHMVWSAPLTLTVTIVLLVINLTYSALVGILLFLLSLPVVTFGIIVMFKRRKIINKITDERVTITQEALSAIRFIKYYAWENDFLARLARVRRREIGGIRWLLGTRNVVNTIGNTIPIFASMLSFITFSATNHVLDPAPVFSSLALFNQLRAPLILIPMILGMVSDALQSVSRIEEFLLAEDSPREDPIIDEGSSTASTDIAVDLETAAFTWEQSTPPDPNERLRTTDITAEEMREAKGDAKTREKEAKERAKRAAKERKKALKAGLPPPEPKGEEKKAPAPETPPFKIEDINLRIGKHELVGIVGVVGCGKSSLLSAISGQMRQTDGSRVVNGRIAYCSQVPWIQNATVRDNITFGQDFDQEKYDRVIEACSLTQDLRILPHGSSTEIGERGINLSGGQKHRVSLARAIYFDADIFLLDDPLAAVDAHVGAHLMDKAICGLLENKCRLLATHQLHVLSHCDRIVMMDKGRIAACDTFQNLMTSNETFKRMLATVDTSERAEKEAEAAAEEPVPPKALELSQGMLMQEEDRQVNSISWEVWLDYWRSTGSLLFPVLILATLILAQGCNIMTNLWLAWWSGDRFGFVTGKYIGIYAALGVSNAIFLFVSTLAFSVFGTESSKRMLHRATVRLLHAPISFFDTTPLGRIMNRFSKDIDVMDNNLSESMRMASTTITMVLSIVALTISYYYYFAIVLIPVLIIYLFASAYYRASARQMKRHEAVLRSSVFARFSEAITGTPTLRSYGVTGEFSRRIKDAIDNMDSAYFLTIANQRWLTIRLDVISVVCVFVTGILVVTNKFSVDPSIAGLVLSYMVSIAQALQFSVRQVADVENNMNATERIHYYGHSVPQEADHKAGTADPPADWPQRGEIVFQAVQLRYRPNLPLVLHDFTLQIRPGEKLAIVGRTGAGKSSIMTAFFRIVEPAAGSITIDGVDIASVPLHTLRSRMAIIPQDATLLRGTIRSNLDPFGQRSDLELWSALRQVHLVPESGGAETAGPGHKLTLETAVEAEGANFSVGERQLLALARALVRDARIVVADEATSSIDFESDARIQKAMVRGFRGKTLLCIAHRLKTIIGYDRVCVIEDGRVVELDTPMALFDVPGGRFRQMCEESRIGREEIEVAGRFAAGDGEEVASVSAGGTGKESSAV